MPGENFIYILFLLLIQSFTSAQIIKQEPDPMVFIRGGILFEQVRDAPVTINPPTMLFTRRLNFSKIDDAVWQTQSFAKEYKKFCNTINDKLQTYIKSSQYDKYFITDTPFLLRDSHRICARNNARLPEVRDKKNFQDVTQLAHIRGVTFIPAGIEPDFRTYTFKYISDNADAIMAQDIFPNVFTYQNSTKGFTKCERGGRGGYVNNQPCVKMTENMIGMFYVLIDNRWSLTVVPTFNYYNTSFPIICEKMFPNENFVTQNNLLLKMSAHSCTRDLLNIQNTANAIIEEVGHFVTIDKERSKEMSQLSRRNDYFEYNHFRGFVIEPAIFCSVYMSKTFKSPCDKFENFLNTLQNISAKISDNTQIPDEFIATYLATQALSITQLVQLPSDFNPCGILPKIYRLQINELNDDLARLVTYVKVTSYKCAVWHNNQFTETYRLKLAKPAIAKMTLPVFEDFYKLRFITEAAPSGKNLSELNERIKRDKIQMYKLVGHPIKLQHFLMSTHKEVPHDLNSTDYEFTTLKPTLNTSSQPEHKPLNMTLRRIKRVGLMAGGATAFLAGELIINT